MLYYFFSDPNSAKSKRIVKPLVNKKTCPDEPKERKHLINQSEKFMGEATRKVKDYFSKYIVTKI